VSVLVVVAIIRFPDLACTPMARIIVRISAEILVKIFFLLIFKSPIMCLNLPVEIKLEYVNIRKESINFLKI